MTPDSSRRDDAILVEMERIVEEHATRFRRLLAADLAQMEIDRQAMDVAIDAYDLEYHRLYDPEYGDEASHCDAQCSGVEVAIKTYLTEMGQS